MRTSVSGKRCPECGKITGLQAAQCRDCGHLFRTRFQEPDNRTQAFDAVMLPRPPAMTAMPARPPRSNASLAFGLAFLGSFCLVAVVGILGWLVWDINQTPALPQSRAATFVSAPSSGRAEDLYDRISLSMSLYDLDQAAGGMGRVIHSPNPNLMILSYDFPDQSVRVSLSRTDPSVNNYRVQGVALFHGNKKLQSRADGI